jgi:hypothetical protein
LWVVALAAAGITGDNVIAANPASTSAIASVNLLQPISITQDFNLDFGKIIAPTSGFEEFTVNPTTNAMSESGGDGQAISGHSRGQYDIDGTDGVLYTLTTSFNGCPGSGGLLQLTGLTTDASLPTTLDDIDLHIGGTLKVQSGVAPGPYLCVYSIAAQY